jgi:hypothetical protein
MCVAACSCARISVWLSRSKRVADRGARGQDGPAREWMAPARCRRMGEKDGVDVVLGQEHNLHPSREGELRRTAESRGFALVIAFAPCGMDGVHWGGTLVLIRTSSVGWPELRDERESMVVHREPGAVVVRVHWHGRYPRHDTGRRLKLPDVTRSTCKAVTPHDTETLAPPSSGRSWLTTRPLGFQKVPARP